MYHVKELVYMSVEINLKTDSGEDVKIKKKIKVILLLFR